MKKNFLAVLSVAGALVLCAPVMKADAAWKITSSGRIYTIKKSPGYAVGWKKIGNYTYYFDENGIMVTGWKTIKNRLYYFDEEGRKLTSQWVDDRYLGAKGYVIRVRNGATKKLEEETEAKKNGWDGTQYYVDGVMQTGWLTLDGKTYFLSRKTGKRVTGVVSIDKFYYYFDTKTGVQKTGWRTYKNKRYYFSKKTNKKGHIGSALKGWNKVGGKYYYFSTKGVLAVSQWIDTVYYVNETGQRVTGWQDIDGKRYYFNTRTGKRLTGWKTVDGKKYYFNADGSLLQSSGIITYNSKKYYVDAATGEKLTGWQEINGKKYYFDPTTAVACKGWKLIDGYYYYFSSQYVLSTGPKWINSTYYINEQGQRQYGWITEQSTGKTYYLGLKTGKKVTKWRQIDGYSYYFGTDGALVTSSWIDELQYVDSTGRMAVSCWVGSYYVGADGKRTGETRSAGLWTDTDGCTYLLDENLQYLTGWQVVDGSSRYFDPETGHMLTSAWFGGFYLGSDGIPVIGSFITVDGYTYYLTSTGAKATGYYQVDKYYYYFNENGEMQTGFQTIDAAGTTRYFKTTSGRMAFSTTLEINGVDYRFAADGSYTIKKSSTTTLGDQIAAYAQEFIGNAYSYGGKWNGETPYVATDCSGFVQGVMAHFGISIPRVAADQAVGTDGWGSYTKAIIISEEELQPGDLVFYYNPVGHVGLYIGDGKIVHASNSSPYPIGGVKVSTYNYATITACVRYWAS